MSPADPVRLDWSVSTAALMARFCALAYALPAQIATAIAFDGFEVAQVFTRDNLQAFLAIKPGEMAVLAFRGTANLADWGFDLDATRIALPGFPGVCVHAGFWGAWADLEGEVLAAVAAHVHPDLPLTVTGHSLGAAVAQIAAVMLRRLELQVYTFGSPRVGTAGFDVALACDHYRVIDRWDLVTAVPPPSPWGYQHAGDPRLLVGPSPKAVLRRDRGWLERLAVYALAALWWPVTHRLPDIEAHMIWNYQRRLAGVLAAEGG